MDLDRHTLVETVVVEKDMASLMIVSECLE